MALLKEDGRLDIQRINKLPIEEHMKVIGSLTEEKYKEFLHSVPLNESRGYTKAVKVKHTMQDLLAQGWITSEDLINNLRKSEFR